MARYTTELGTIKESGYNIFNFEYPFYKESERSKFEQMFVNHFYFREIGQETVPRFQHYLALKFNETLPFYNMLLETAQIEYERTINYNLVETFERENDKTNTLDNTQTGDTSENGSISSNNTVNHTANNSHIDNKTGTDISNANGTATNTDVKEETLKDNTTTSSTVSKDTDVRDVTSDTPQGLLDMADIKNDLYASKANIQDNLEKVDSTDTVTGTKTNDSTDTQTNTHEYHNTNTNTENVNGSVTENVTDTATGGQTSSNSVDSLVKTNQTVNENDKENYTRTTRGSYGVITEADMLQKHINLQKILTNIYKNFFDECEDLFMGIY